MALTQLNRLKASNHHETSSVEKGRIIKGFNRTILTNPPKTFSPSLLKPLSVYNNYFKFPKLEFIAIHPIMFEGKPAVSFPRFFDTKILKSFFPDHDLVSYGEMIGTFEPVKDTPSIDINIQWEKIRDDPLQDEALDYVLSKNDYEHLNQLTHKVLSLQTGTGKTLITILTMGARQSKTCIFLHSPSMILTPWMKDLLNFTDLTENDIGIIQGLPSLKKAIKDKVSKKVYLINNKSADSFIKNNKPLFDDFFQLGKFDLRVYDEAHKAFKTISLLNAHYDEMFNLTISSTATPERSKYSENTVYRHMLPNPKLWFGNETRLRHPPHLTWHRVGFKSNVLVDDEVIREVNGTNGVNINAYANYFVNFELAFNDLFEIVDSIIRDTVERDLRLMIFVPSLALITKLIEKVKSDDSYRTLTVGNFTSLVDKKEKHKELSAQVIFTTDKSIDAGVDVPLDVIILLTPLSSKSLITQIVGRIRRKVDDNNVLIEKPYDVYDVFDKTFDAIVKNSKYRYKNAVVGLSREIIDY
jgi:superfamily II DNA or RNA helicase